MNETIIRNHNSRVKPNDAVFFLGDFCFRNTANGKEGEGSLNRAEYYLNKLNGRFTFIRGNHDNNNSLKAIIEYCVIHLGGQEMFLCHNPADFNSAFKINLVGHVHTKWKIKKEGRSILYNVGVDLNRFMPISINDILGEIEAFKKK